MAQPITARAGKFRILLGDSASPMVYSAPCGFTSKSLTLTRNLSEVSIPDCDSPDAPITLGRDVESISTSVSGEGVAAAESIPVWLEAYNSSESVPVKLEIEYSTGTVTWTGNMQIESLEFGAEQGGRVTLNVSMQSDGPMVQTDTFA
jgi:predicted secreted protein